MVELSMSAKQSNVPLDSQRVSEDPFPLKLHKLLQQLELEGKQHILGWNPDGRSFAIFQPKLFASTIMIQHFRQSKYKSFQRQLNLYDFTRETVGSIKGVYSHPMFVRHDRELSRNIKRVRGPTKEGSSRHHQRHSAVGVNINAAVLKLDSKGESKGSPAPATTSFISMDQTMASVLFDSQLRDSNALDLKDTRQNEMIGNQVLSTTSMAHGLDITSDSKRAVSTSQTLPRGGVQGLSYTDGDEESIDTIDGFDNLNEDSPKNREGNRDPSQKGGDSADSNFKSVPI